MSIRAEDLMTICKHCGSSDLDGIEHGRVVADPSDYESGMVVCLHPCGHEAHACWALGCNICQPELYEDEPF